MFSSPYPSLFSLLAIIACVAPSAANAQGKLGVTLKDLGNNRGALVTQVENGSSAVRMICPHCNEYHHITPGVNVITHVNGQFTGNTQAVVNAIGRSRLDASFTIANLNNPGHTTTYRTRLTPSFAGNGSTSYQRSYDSGSYRQQAGYSSPASQRRFGRWIRNLAEASKGIDDDSDIYGGIDFDFSTDDSNDGIGSYGGGLGNNFHLKMQQNSFNRNYGTNADHR